MGSIVYLHCDLIQFLIGHGLGQGLQFVESIYLDCVCVVEGWFRIRWIRHCGWVRLYTVGIGQSMHTGQTSHHHTDSGEL
jgi:hypothetical protein